MHIETNSFDTLKSKIVKSLKDFLSKDTVTPVGEKNIPCEIHIPYNQIKQDEEEDNVASAVATYVVSFNQKEKKHTVRFKFKYEPNGKYVKDSLQYI